MAKSKLIIDEGKKNEEVTTSPSPSMSPPTSKPTDAENRLVLALVEFTNKTLGSLSEKVKNIQDELEKQKTSSHEDIQNITSDYKKEIETLKTDTKPIKEAVKNLNEKEFKVIEALGIFFALFTFISINIQIFSRISDLFTAISFSMIMFCLLTIMVIIFNFLLMFNNKKPFLIAHGVLLAVFITLAIGIFVIIGLTGKKLNPIENTKEFNDAVDQRVNEKLDSKYYDRDKIDELMQKLQITPPTAIPTSSINN